MKRYFIVNVPPHHLCGKYHTSFAASNFSWALINSNVFDEYFSILPSNINGAVDDIQMEGLVYSDLRKRNVFLRKLAPLTECITIYKKIEPHSSVWFYNIGILNILLFYLLRWFKPSVKLNAILLDIYVPRRKFSSASFVLRTMNIADGTIKLANSDLFTCRNTVCMPGVVPFNTPSFPKVITMKRSFLLSGQLREDISQTRKIIEAFSKVPSVTLNISGFAVGITDDELTKMCSQFPNIHYFGNVGFDEYLSLLHSNPFLLSTRDPQIIDNQCNFPSKVIEAILHNRIIVSTIHYEQLEGLKYFEIPSDIEGLIKALQDISKTDDEELLTYANQSDYAKKHFNPNEWAKNMSVIESGIAR